MILVVPSQEMQEMAEAAVTDIDGREKLPLGYRVRAQP